MLLHLKYLFIQRVARLHIDLASSPKSTSSLLETSDNNLKGKIITENSMAHKYFGKISRNQLCPCNSGKKFKHCHGALK
ncbi:SEC-C motif family protein [Orientia tsutsugamushi str. UT76]|nr:SEC-C motif family protein [Orientia tsutsugamushi str. UT76]